MLNTGLMLVTRNRNNGSGGVQQVVSFSKENLLLANTCCQQEIFNLGS